MKHLVPELTHPERLRTYAQRIFHDIYPSKKGVKKAIEKGLVKINGEPSGTGRFIQPGDVIELIQLAAPDQISPAITLEVLYQDDHCLVVKKPAGVPVHSNSHYNMVNLLAANVDPCKLPDALPVPMPLHRLDSPTGGLLLVARSRSFQVKTGKLFEDRAITKNYKAIVLGRLKEEGIFKNPINGKYSETRYRSIQYSFHQKYGDLTLVKLNPVTGRTHQLRIHCAQAGSPILGERKYAPEFLNLSGKGLYLYADELDFIHPITNVRVHVEIKLPGKFIKLLDN